MKLQILALFILLPFVSDNVHAGNVNRIHLKNGDIISGTILEFNEEAREYKIETRTGTVFNLNETEIKKIIVDSNHEEPEIKKIQRPDIKQTTNLITSLNPSKKHNFGVGLFILSFVSEKNYAQLDNDSLTYSGYNLFYQYGITDHFAARLNIYSLDTARDDRKYFLEKTDVRGLEGQFLLSSNTNKNGWKFYLGGIFFIENWDNNSLNSPFPIPNKNEYQGIGGVFGLGYNFQQISIDFAISIRSKSEYDISKLDSASSGGFTVGYRL